MILSRRAAVNLSAWMKPSVWVFVIAGTVGADEPVDVGSRRELFVDDYLIERLDHARRVLHHPTPREVVLKHDAPWEGRRRSAPTDCLGALHGSGH